MLISSATTGAPSGRQPRRSFRHLLIEGIAISPPNSISVAACAASLRRANYNDCDTPPRAFVVAYSALEIDDTRGA